MNNLKDDDVFEFTIAFKPLGLLLTGAMVIVMAGMVMYFRG